MSSSKKYLNIVFIASAASIHSIRWVNYFVNKKNKITLISLVKPSHVTQNELNKLEKNIQIYYLNNLINLLKIFIFLKSGKYSLVHIHYLGWHSLLSLFINSKSKLIITPWGSDLSQEINFFKKIWLKILFRKSNFLICDSKRLVKKSIEFGFNNKNFMISMFGVDTDLYKKSRDIFSLKGNYAVGSNRNLEKIYDVKTLLKAAELICRIRNDISFYIAGNGLLKENYTKFVKQKNLTANIKFLGQLNKKEMLDFYNKIDIYISTSLSDGGLASSIAEAMSFERLIIISNNSDNKIWIKNNINGFLFNSGDYKSLSKLIIDSVKFKEKSIQISKLSRDLIINKNSYQKEMKKVENKYFDLIRN
jgi:glycosyltransferase involved in cell wall biosynthesis